MATEQVCGEFHRVAMRDRSGVPLREERTEDDSVMNESPFARSLPLIILISFLILLPGLSTAQTRHPVPPALATITAEFNRTMIKVNALISQTAAEIGHAGKESPESRQKVIELCRDMPLALYCTLIDADGTVVIGEPAEAFSAEGINTLGEDYIRTSLREDRPVMSKMFKTRRGPYAVSLVHPVRFRDSGARGALAVYFRPDISLGAIVKRIPVYLPVEVTVIQTDGQIVFDGREEAIGKNLLKDEEFQGYRQLVNLGWRAVKSATGTGSYAPVRKKGQPDVRKVANWDTVSLYGTEWRVIMIRTEASDIRYGPVRPTQANLSLLDRALRNFSRSDGIRKALSDGDRQRALDHLGQFYKANREIYSVQWVDVSGINRFGYPAATSLVDYNYHDMNNPDDEKVLKVLRDKTEASFSRELMEGGTGRFFFCPVVDGEVYLGTLYSIVKTK